MATGDFVTLDDDAYSRVPFDAAHYTLTSIHGGALTFVDIDAAGRLWDEVLGWFEVTPPALLARSSTVLLRWPTDLADSPDASHALRQLQTQFAARNIHPRLGAVIFQIGRPPTVTWSDGRPAPEDEVLLQRARRIELASFLNWSGAIWRPRGYHYRLPSGHHVRTVVRFADALRDARASAAIATWLYAALSEESATTVVLDSGTLSPIVTELRAAADRAGRRVADVIPLDSYPVSKFEYRRLVKRAESTRVLGLLSVSATGRAHGRFESVLRETVGNDFRLELLVSRNHDSPQATRVPMEPVNGRQAAWLNLTDELDGPIQPDGGNCRACRDPSTAALVHIDPISMSAMALPEPQLLVPDIFDGQRNRSLWERYNDLTGVQASEAISLDGPTGTRASTTRTEEQPAQTFFEPARLFAAAAHTGFLTDRFEQLGVLPRRSRNDRTVDIIRGARDAVIEDTIDAIVIDAEEYGLLPPDQWTEIVRCLCRAGTHTQTDIPPLLLHQRAGDPVGPIVRADGAAVETTSSNLVLLFTLGVRTGVTLQRMFLAARERWPDASLRGIVLHAHPSDSRIWEGIRNTFKDDSGTSRLLALWLTYLPRRSPLEEELSLLRAVNRDELQRDLDLLVQGRIEGQGEQLFWGPRDIVLRPTSYYGDRLREDVALVAVGSAMHAERLHSRRMGTPYWAVFDLPRILRSYFDGLIHAAVLRWLEPGEAWWGTRDSDCVSLLQEVESRAPHDWEVLLPELLLAGAMNKLPEAGISHLVNAAASQLRDKDWAPRLLDWVRLGQLLCEMALEP